MDERKAAAIAAGEAAGEAFAAKLFASGGIEAVRATLEHGAETWEQDAIQALYDKSDKVHGVYLPDGKMHPYAVMPFCRVFARGARRCAEQYVSGSAAAGESNQRIAQLRTRLGDRPALVAAFDAGLALAKKGG